jgi:hypothetical protein
MESLPSSCSIGDNITSRPPSVLMEDDELEVTLAPVVNGAHHSFCRGPDNTSFLPQGVGETAADHREEAHNVLPVTGDEGMPTVHGRLSRASSVAWSTMSVASRRTQRRRMLRQRREQRRATEDTTVEVVREVNALYARMKEDQRRMEEEKRELARQRVLLAMQADRLGLTLGASEPAGFTP